ALRESRKKVAREREKQRTRGEFYRMEPPSSPRLRSPLLRSSAPSDVSPTLFFPERGEIPAIARFFPSISPAVCARGSRPPAIARVDGGRDTREEAGNRGSA